MSNISYPHPVLGNSDDIEGSLSINIDGEIKDNELSIIQKDLTLDNEYFEKLIEDKKAQIIHKITCSSTLFSKIILGELKDSIDCNKISKQVKVETKIIALIGEIGGPQEAEAAEYIRDHMSKPVVAYVAGLTAPKGRTMGHAGAIISAFGESASEKVEILSAAGVTVAEHPSVIGETIASLM